MNGTCRFNFFIHVSKRIEVRSFLFIINMCNAYEQALLLETIIPSNEENE